MNRFVNRLAVATLSVFFISSAALATDSRVNIVEMVTQEVQDNHFDVQNIMTPECGSFSVSRKKDPVNPLNPIDEVGIIVDKIINIGKKIWTVVKLGQPVVNIQMDVATAMPEGVQCWLDLQTWQVPQSKTYQTTFINGFGDKVVDFKYRVLWVHGGSVDGVGQYIGYATMIPINVSVLWGYKFDATATVPLVMNMGTKANPVGGMQMVMQYKINTALQHTQQSQAYFIGGDGQFKKLE